MGQKREVTVKHLVVANSVESNILKLIKVWRCKLTPGCPRVDRAWFQFIQRLKLQYDGPHSNFTCIFNLRRYIKERGQGAEGAAGA